MMFDTIHNKISARKKGSLFLNLLVGLSFVLGPQASFANSNLSCSNILRTTDRLEFTKDDMLAYEMVAASVVFLMIKNEELIVPHQSEIQLRERDVTNINSELSKAFDAIFINEMRRDQRMTFVRIAEKRSKQQAKRDRRSERFRNFLTRIGLSRDKGATKEVVDGINKIKPNNNHVVNFDYSRLQKLYKSDPDFVFTFLKHNTEAIVDNGRRLSKIKFKNIATKFGNPPAFPNFIKYGALGAIGLSLFVPHLDDPMFKLGLLEDFWYVYLWQSSKFALFMILVEGGIYFAAKPITSWWSTSGAPNYPERYQEDIGADVREAFADGDDFYDLNTPEEN